MGRTAPPRGWMRPSSLPSLSAGHQTLLTPLVPAIEVTNVVRLAAQIESLARARAGQKVQRLCLKIVDGPHGSRLIDSPIQTVEALFQADAVAQSLAMGLVFETDVRHCKVWVVRIAVHGERPVGRAEVGRTSDGEVVISGDRVHADVVRSE